jgi:enamine deaminase RidA (YjgF/YER057c/UK114 family)
MADVVNPDSLAPGRGYSNGMILGPGRVLFVAGMIGWDRDGKMISREIAAQFGQAMDNVLAVVREAGGTPESIGRFTIYVTDKRAYIAAAKAIGEKYRERMGKHYPAMALVQVADLLEDGAMVEIEATAVVP